VRRRWICRVVDMHGRLLAGKLVFYRMPERRRPPLGLRFQSGLLIPLSPQLLYAQVVLMDGDAQDHLGAVLVDNELVEVLPE